MAVLKTPLIAVIIGEGGSGGALALGLSDRVFMLENAIYSVISPEGCAAILWKDATQKERAAEALKLTAPDLKGLDIIDDIIPEPSGGAHADPGEAARLLGVALERAVSELERLPPDRLIATRAEKFLRMGRFTEQ
jgi:acetyl-CoA carboxylase carboxyl transferase subunit alpha